jgi:hypothetical protein
MWGRSRLRRKTNKGKKKKESYVVKKNRQSRSNQARKIRSADYGPNKRKKGDSERAKKGRRVCRSRCCALVGVSGDAIPSGGAGHLGIWVVLSIGFENAPITG